MLKTIKILTILITIWLITHLVIMLILGLQSTKQTTDAILILGNKVELNGQPSKRLQSRLDEGIRLYQNNQAPLIIVSGSLGKEGFDEAKVMHDYLVQNKIPSKNIIQDNQGINTYSTAKNLQTINQEYQIQSIIIVSQYYHILRTKLALSKFEFKQTYSSYAKMPPEIRDLYSIPREILGYYIYLTKK